MLNIAIHLEHFVAVALGCADCCLGQGRPLDSSIIVHNGVFIRLMFAFGGRTREIVKEH